MRGLEYFPTYTEDNAWRTLRRYLESIYSSERPIDEVTLILDGSRLGGK